MIHLHLFFNILADINIKNKITTESINKLCVKLPFSPITKTGPIINI